MRNGKEKNLDNAVNIGSYEDDVLAGLICKWCDVQPGELKGAWQQKTYEASIGDIYYESRPTERSIVVGTMAEADKYAVEVFRTLGIDSQAPDGFSYKNDEVGSVSYKHSSEGTTLAVIDVEVKQIPQLSRITLLTTPPTNAETTPYYKMGDVIKYEGRYYICVSNHKGKQKARFITFNDQADLHHRGLLDA